MKVYYNTIFILLFAFAFSDVNGPTIDLNTSIEEKSETIKYQQVPPVGNKELIFLNGDPVKFDDLYSSCKIITLKSNVGCR